MDLRKLLFIAFYAFMALGVPGLERAAAQQSPPAVLVIDDADPDSPFGRSIREKIHSTLDAEAAQGYAIFTEFLNLGHFNEVDYDATLKEYIRKKYRNSAIKVIIAIGSGALRFATLLRTDVWSSVPIVFETFDEDLTREAIPANVTGIIAPLRFQDLVQCARVLVPQLAQIVLVGDPIQRQPYRRHYADELKEVKKELNVIDMTGHPLNEAEKRVTDLPGNAAIVYIPVFGDASGMIHNPGEALKNLTKAANRPIVVDNGTFIGNGATGGFVPSAENLGRDIGARAARILRGVSASDIPIEVKQFTVPIFDARQLDRWGISDAVLPVGSKIQFRQPDVWQRYWWQILAAFIAIVVQAAIIGWLLFEHRRRRFAEHESHQHLLELTKMDRAMTASTMSSSIAHELSQPLSAILNNAEAAEILLSANSPDCDEIKAILADIRSDDQRAVDIIKHVRMLLKHDDLSQHETNLTELVSDTVRFMKSYAASNGTMLQVEALPEGVQVRAARVHVQQVILNLILNAIDAMQRKPVTERVIKLAVRREDEKVLVSIADTGEGIPHDKMERIFEPFITTKEQGTGLGLSIARTLIYTYGGKIWAENAEKGGAIFHFSLRAA